MNPTRTFCCPHRLSEWLPEGHLGYFISDSVDALNLSAFHARTAPKQCSFEQLSNSETDVLVSMAARASNKFAERKPHRPAMAVKLRSPEGQAACRKRKWIAEPPHGWIKSVLGFRRFSMRGLHRVTAEWKLVCAALNLRRMCSLQPAERHRGATRASRTGMGVAPGAK